jgi:DmsE family decaheme c-type cytochrome
MNLKQSLSCALLACAGLAWQPTAWAQAAPLPSADEYTPKGADTCLGCHDDESATYVMGAIFKSKHGQRGDKRTPFGQGGLQCEACHGPGALHARNKKAAAINTFKPDSKVSLEGRNEICLTCHQGAARNAWHAGAHERAKLACTDCHKMHQERDPMLAKASQPEVCETCHKQQRAEFLKASSHPVRQGLMACSDCHNPHGSTAQAMLAQPTLNLTCFSCHADKRGPLLWEHAPVAEDCSLCHTPHGSVRAALLTKSPPLLCQQCHSAAGHPSVPRTGAALPANGGTGAIFVVAGSCTNCHTQVHGSNHPSGAKLMR